MLAAVAGLRGGGIEEEVEVEGVIGGVDVAVGVVVEERKRRGSVVDHASEWMDGRVPDAVVARGRATMLSASESTSRGIGGTSGIGDVLLRSV